MSGRGSGTLPVWLGGAAIAGAVAIGGVYVFGRGDVSVPDGVETAAAPSPAVAVQEPAPEPTAEAAPEAAATLPAPKIDEFRLEADGVAVIAGRSVPGDTIILRLDGSELTSARTEASGLFATVAFIDPSDAVRVLTLVAMGADGTERLSPDELILAPSVIAEPQPEPAPLPDPAPDVVADVSAAEALAPQAEEASDPAPAPSEAAPTAEAEQTPEQPVVVATAGSAPAPDAVLDTASDAPSDAPSEEMPAPDTAVAEVAALPEVDPVFAPEPETDVVQAAPAPEPEQPAVVAAAAPEPTPEEPPATPDPVVAEAAPLPEAPSEPAALDAVVEVVETPEQALPAEQDVAAAPPVPAQGPDVQADVPSAPSAPAPVASSAVQPATTAAARPPAPNLVTILRSSPEGVEVVQSPGTRPSAQRRVELDAISYSAEGDVQLSGRAERSASEVRIYLDNRPVAAIAVDKSGDWRGDVPDIASGVYTLRIDSVDTAGTVQSRVETPFKREAPELLLAAVAESDTPMKAITVQKGATLWAIARERYGDPFLYVQVFEANRTQIRDPDLIYPGQVFTLPEGGGE